MARKMTFSGQKYYNNGPDKNEAGKSPKPSYKKIDNPNQPKKKTNEEGKKVLQNIEKLPDVHPVTGKKLTLKEKQEMARQIEHRKNAGYNS